MRWLSPPELLRTGAKVALGSVAASYADKRDVMSGAVFEQDIVEPHASVTRADEFWFDFVSDTGDGFAAMCTVATLLGAPTLVVREHATTPVGVEHKTARGSLLIMGGDEVYPVGDVRAYEERLEAPLRAQWVEAADDATTLLAIPGNHDWYDGLTAFLRVFCQGRPFAGRRTVQRRSYFAVRLPHRWWIVAIDIQLDTYIDATQLEYFREVMRVMEPGAEIILCTARPSWYGAQNGDLTSMDRLAFFVREVIAKRDDVALRLVLTGDAHHYARYSWGRTEDDRPNPEGLDQVLLTAGHGGAYTSATHHLSATLDVAGDLTGPGSAASGAGRTYRLSRRTWPPSRQSAIEACKVLVRLPWRNPSLVALLAILEGVVVGGWAYRAESMAIAAQLLVTAGAVAFTRPARPTWWRRLLAGVSLGVPASAIGVTAASLAERWELGSPTPGAVGALIGLAVAAGTAATVVLALYLLVASPFANQNELFAAQSIEDYKGFLRLRIDRDGALTVFPIGVIHSSRRWTWCADASPRYVADRAPCPELIEAPVVLRPRGSTPS